MNAARDPKLSCVPVVRQESLASEANWDHPVVVERPRFGVYDRKLRCKSVPCAYVGARLPVDEKLFLPLEVEKGGVWRGGIPCRQGCVGGDNPGCPHIPASRALGIIHAHRVPGQTSVLLSFELIGIESPSGKPLEK